MNRLKSYFLIVSLLTISFKMTSQQELFPYTEKVTDTWRVDTVYYPFSNGQQLVVLDHLSYFTMLDIQYSTMSQMPYGYWDRPIGNEYFFRDTNGVIKKSYNSSLNWDTLARLLKSIDFTAKEMPHNRFYDTYEEKVARKYFPVFNYTIQSYVHKDTAFHLKTGIIDMNGKLIIPTEFDVVRNYNDCFLVGQDQKFGIVDNQFNYLVNLKYSNYQDRDSLIYLSDKRWIDAVFNFNAYQFNDITKLDLREFDQERGFLMFQKDSLFGLINVLTNEVLVSNDYNRIVNYYCHSDWRYLNHGLMIVQKGKYFGVVNLKGEVIIPCLYDKIIHESESKNGIIKVQINEKVKEIDVSKYWYKYEK